MKATIAAVATTLAFVLGSCTTTTSTGTGGAQTTNIPAISNVSIYGRTGE